jgi:homogentisate 1,2-dioxygenase
MGPYCEPKRIQHPQVGLLELHGQSLVDPDQPQILTVFTASPGTESHDKLQFLSVLPRSVAPPTGVRPTRAAVAG